jgi:hypothetical protein
MTPPPLRKARKEREKQGIKTAAILSVYNSVIVGEEPMLKP